MYGRSVALRAAIDTSVHRALNYYVISNTNDPKMPVRLTEREADLMNVLWEHGPSTVAEVHARLGERLAYTTVLTMLRMLEAKRAVTRIKEGRAHRYAARIARASARRRALAAVAAKFFRGSTAGLLAHLVENERLSDTEIARLREILERPKRERG